MNNNKTKKWLCLLLSFAVSVPLLAQPAEVQAEEAGNFDYYQGITYNEYTELNKDAGKGTDVLTVNATEYSEGVGTVSVVDDPTGTKDNKVVYTGDDGDITYQVDIKKAGMYSLQLEYMPAAGNENDIERNILIDGEIPFKQAQFVTFTRIWHDAEEIRQDINGNDIRPAQEEVSEWRTVYVYDSGRYSNDPLNFYLSAGTHQITIEGIREPMYVSSVSVRPYEGLKSYSEVKAEYEAKGYKAATAETIKVQAENMYQKSDYTLYQSADRSSAISEPQDPAKQRLNQISGEKFKLAGQWVSWEIEVPEDGLYEIAPRYKQNILSGLFSTRTLKIDGEIPFAEAAFLQFNFSQDWQVEAFGNGEENYQFYLTAGKHVITLEVSLGEMADVISKVDGCVAELNNIYREITVITGPDADVYRDYNFDKQIPKTIENMKVQADLLASMSDYLENVVGTKGEQVVALDKLVNQLEKMYEDPNDQIAGNHSQFKTNVGSLADWVVTVSDQPLSLDYILVTAPEAELPDAEAGFFKSLAYEVKSFFMSFFTDYSTLGQTVEAEKTDGDTVEVWITSGRDQSNIIRQMINSTFTPQTGINIDLKLVSAGSLLPAVLSGQGPDIALGNGLGDPIQYALRGAVVDLSQFENYDEVASRFHESALVSYTYDGKVYAIPETQSFPMMFYRKDILAQYGLSVPQTWDDFFEVVSILQRNNMQVGFPNGMSGMQIFLYQDGGSLYTEDLTKVTFDQDQTLDAFQDMLDLFTTYKFPRDYSFANRFRTGEMPLAIQDYGEYNGLTAFAPEIKGLWGMAPIPGTVQEDGSINRAAACAGTCAMMLRGTKVEDAAWTFLDWWTTAEVQSEFAREMKTILGKAAMYATANMEAISSMPWTKEEYTALYEQWENIVGTPEVPGNYYVTRNIGFAAVDGYETGNAEELLDWVNDTNEEMLRKRIELGLEE